MSRFNLISRMSRYILPNIFIRTIADIRHNTHIYKIHVPVKHLSQTLSTKRYLLYDKCKFQEGGRFRLLIASLPTLIFSFSSDSEDTDEDPTSKIIMTIKRSVLLIQKGEFKKAEQMLHLALRQAQTLQHDAAVTYIYDVMANLAFDTGDYRKAETLFVSVLQRLISKGTSENDMKVIHISLKMAKVFENMGEIKKAEQGYNFCLENLQSHIQKDSENEDVILLQGMTYDWYARMLLSQSRYTEASKYFLQAYNISKKMYGEIHEQTVILLNDLGTVSYKQEKYDEAIEYLSAASEIGKNLPDMIELGIIYVNLGNVFLKKGLYKEAIKFCQEGRKLAKNRNDNDSLLEAEECLKEVKKSMSL